LEEIEMADRYSYCPICTKSLNKKLKEGYGKLPEAEYKQIQNQLHALGYTVREDYEMGIHDGAFFVDYHGKCSECGFTHKFNHEEQF
jgi:hypothetical protein